MLFGSVSKKHVLHRDVSGSDLEKVVKSRSRIVNEGLGVSAGLGFYHSIPLQVRFKLVTVNKKMLFHSAPEFFETSNHLAE